MSVADVLRVARAEIGYITPRNDGSKYGKWYANHTGYSWYGGAGVAYCAMFVSWVYDQCPGDSIPGGYKAYVPYFINEARNAGALRTFEQAQAGDLICFDWDDDGVADHVGIVEQGSTDGYSITTIEGNTSPGAAGSQSNGGGVWRRTRYKTDVCAIIRTSHTSPTRNDTLLERISKMNATHVFFEHGGKTCVANILTGTWRRLPDGEAYKHAQLALSRAGAITKSWQQLGARSNHVDDPEGAFGREVTPSV